MAEKTNHHPGTGRSRLAGPTPWLLLGLALAALPTAAQTTLGEALAASGVRPTAALLDPLDDPIWGSAELDRPGELVFVYEPFLETRPTSLVVLRLDRASGTWTRRDLDLAASEAAACLGTVQGVGRTGPHLVISTHLTPSAGCSIPLAEDLSPLALLPGWVLASFEDGTLVYARSQPHWQSYHPFAAAVWSPASRSEQDIYPLRPWGRHRTQHIREVAAALAALGEEWCARENRPLDPELFDETLVEAEAGETTGAVALVVAFDRLSRFQEPEVAARIFAAGALPARPVEIVHVIRGARPGSTPEHVELSWEEVHARFGEGAELADLLTEDALERLFTPPRP